MPALCIRGSELCVQLSEGLTPVSALCLSVCVAEPIITIFTALFGNQEWFLESSEKHTVDLLALWMSSNVSDPLTQWFRNISSTLSLLGSQILPFPLNSFQSHQITAGAVDKGQIPEIDPLYSHREDVPTTNQDHLALFVELIQYPHHHQPVLLLDDLLCKDRTSIIIYNHCNACFLVKCFISLFVWFQLTFCIS